MTLFSKMKIDSKFYASTFSVLLCLFAIYAYSPFIENYAVTPKWIGLALLGVLMFFKKPSEANIDSIQIIWLLFVVQYILSSFNAYNVWDSLIKATPIILAPILAAIISYKWKGIKRKYEGFGLLLALTILPLIIFALIKAFLLWNQGDFNHSTTYQFAFNFGHRNQFAQFLALCIPFFFIGLFDTKTKWKKWFFITVIAFTYLLISLLMCRSVLLVTYVIYPAFALLYYILVIKKIKPKTFVFILVPSLIALIAFIITNPFHFSWVDRMFETGFGSGNERLRIWTNTIDIIKQHPILGVGSGDWKIEILKTPLAFTQAEDSLVFFQRAHNDFIQITAENGFLGLIIILLFFGLVFRKLIHSELNLGVKYSIAGGIFGFLLIANLSFPFEKVELLFLLMMLIHFIPTTQKGFNFKFMNHTRIILLVMIASTSIYWYALEVKYLTFKKQEKIQVLKNLNYNFYSIDPTGLPVTWYIANDYYHKQQYDSAIKWYTIAHSHNPNHVHVLNNLGSSYININQLDTAKIYYQKALTINPIFTETLMNYASLEFNNGNIDGALDKILKVRIDKEPKNYRQYIAAIGQAKIEWLIALYDEAEFENFLKSIVNKPDFLYKISVNARLSGASYEDELRLFRNKQN